MHELLISFVSALMIAQASPALTSSQAPSPVATASPAPATSSGKQILTLDIPPSWHRTQSGAYNEWRGPDGRSKFRVAVSSDDPSFHGPGAAEAIKAMFVRNAAMFNGNTKINVITVMVCNGTQPAYRVDDVTGAGIPAFMMVIPGTTSSGLINYEIFKDGKRDPGIMAAIDKICWP